MDKAIDRLEKIVDGRSVRDHISLKLQLPTPVEREIGTDDTTYPGASSYTATSKSQSR